MITYVDLFCGLGSFHYSLKKLGWKCILASDNNELACSNYFKNFNHQPIGNIHDIDPSTLPEYDVLCAGFPRQPFSQIGKKKGVTDQRETLFCEIMRFVKDNLPRAVVLVNVPSIISHDNGKTFKIIRDTLVMYGYIVHHNILTCSDYGIPQKHRRMFIVAIRAGINANNIFEYPKKNVTLSEYLKLNFSKQYAYTIRSRGRNSPIYSKHNWDGYWIDNKVHRLTLEEGKRLQGLDDYNLIGSDTECWRLLGNTIPTIFTHIIGTNLQHVLNDLDVQ